MIKLELLIIFVMEICAAKLVSEHYSVFNDGIRGTLDVEGNEKIYGNLKFYFSIGLVWAVTLSIFSKEIPIHFFLLLADLFGIIAVNCFKYRWCIFMLSGITGCIIFQFVSNLKRIFSHSILTISSKWFVNILVIFFFIYVCCKFLWIIFSKNNQSYYVDIENKYKTTYINKFYSINIYQLIVYICLSILSAKKIISIDVLSCYLFNGVEFLYLIMRIFSNGVNTSYSVVVTSMMSISGTGLIMFSSLTNNIILSIFYATFCYFFEKKFILCLAKLYSRYSFNIFVGVIRDIINFITSIAFLSLIPITISLSFYVYSIVIFVCNCYLHFHKQWNISIIFLLNIIIYFFMITFY